MLQGWGSPVGGPGWDWGDAMGNLDRGWVGMSCFFTRLGWADTIPGWIPGWNILILHWDKIGNALWIIWDGLENGFSFHEEHLWMWWVIGYQDTIGRSAPGYYWHMETGCHSCRCSQRTPASFNQIGGTLLQYMGLKQTTWHRYNVKPVVCGTPHNVQKGWISLCHYRRFDSEGSY